MERQSGAAVYPGLARRYSCAAADVFVSMPGDGGVGGGGGVAAGGSLGSGGCGCCVEDAAGADGSAVACVGAGAVVGVGGGAVSRVTEV